MQRSRGTLYIEDEIGVIGVQPGGAASEVQNPREHEDEHREGEHMGDFGDMGGDQERRLHRVGHGVEGGVRCMDCVGDDEAPPSSFL